MADLSTPLYQLAPSAANNEVRVNELVDALSPGAVYGRNAQTTTGLTWGYYGGRVGGSALANGTLTLADGAANHIVADRATGAVSAATATTNWDDAVNYVRLYKVTTASGAVVDYEDHRFGNGGSHGASLGPAASTSTIWWAAAIGDEVTPISTGTAKLGFVIPFACDVLEVAASLNVAQASGSIVTLDVNVSGSSILSTKITLDNTETTTNTAAAAPAVAGGSYAYAAFAPVTIDVDQCDGATAAAGAKVYLKLRPS